MKLKRGAQIGNNNAVKTKEWLEALRYAAANYVDKEAGIKRGFALKAAAKKVIMLAVAGDKDAYKEIGDRFDGKPGQQIDLGNADGAPFIVKIDSSEQDL